MLSSKGSHYIEKPLQLESSPHLLQLEKSQRSNDDPAQPKKQETNFFLIYFILFFFFIFLFIYLFLILFYF